MRTCYRYTCVQRFVLVRTRLVNENKMILITKRRLLITILLVLIGYFICCPNRSNMETKLVIKEKMAALKKSHCKGVFNWGEENDDSDRVEQLHRLYPNVAFKFLYDRDVMNETNHGKKGCRIKPPCLYDLRINNELWQHLSHPLSNIYLYSAHLDSRPLNPRLSIRVLATIERPSKFSAHKFHGIYCQIWSSHSQDPIVVQATNFVPLAYGLYNDDDKVIPVSYMFECPLQKGILDPLDIKAVSIVTNICQNASNMLRISNYDTKAKRSFAVCLKAVEMAFTDASLRLIEWLEALKLLGAQQVFIYKVRSIIFCIHNILHYDHCRCMFMRTLKKYSSIMSHRDSLTFAGFRFPELNQQFPLCMSISLSPTASKVIFNWRKSLNSIAFIGIYIITNTLWLSIAMNSYGPNGVKSSLTSQLRVLSFLMFTCLKLKMRKNHYLSNYRFLGEL